MNEHAMGALVTFFTEHIEAHCLAEILDDACFNLASAKLDHPDEANYGNVAEQIYQLKMLRDTLKGTSPLANRQTA